MKNQQRPTVLMATVEHHGLLRKNEVVELDSSTEFNDCSKIKFVHYVQF